MATNLLRSEPALPPVLVVEPQAFPRRTLKRVLRALGVAGLLDCPDADGALGALGRVRRQDWVMLCDLDVACENDMALPRMIAERYPEVRIAVLSTRKPDEAAQFAQCAADIGHPFLAVMRKPASAEELRTLLLRAASPPPPATEPAARSLTAAEVTQSLSAEWLHAFFQPRINLATGRAVGCEALARILHPAHGELIPAQFLGAIDAVDGQRTLTAHMLEKSGLLMRALRASGIALTISINVSPDCLSEPGDGAKLASYAGALGLRPSELVLEVSHAAAVRASATAADSLARLKSRGYALSIDDFGTAGTDLPDLLKSAYSEIKLDRSIVERLGRTADPALVAVIGEARRAGMVVCAEGLETEAELAALRHAGADFGQGFLFAPPMTATDLLGWLRQNGPRQRSRSEESFATLS
jgi:EAL domain-containing protein (putative c-di-GMP-specific phosphodiesterase class I)